MTGAPAFLRGRNLNDKLNIAFIACGGRALASLSELTLTPGAPPPGAGRAGSAGGVGDQPRAEAERHGVGGVREREGRRRAHGDHRLPKWS